MGKVTSIVPNGVDKQVLAELSQDENLESFMIVCNWKDKSTTTGWSSNLTNTEVVWDLYCLNEDARKMLEGD